jgi:NAD-dependent dihydropyrimidine dehydrogenase PreA subunit
MTKSSLILFCNCAYSQVISEGVKSEVLNAIKGAGVEFEAVTDLCEMSAKKNPALKRLAKEKRIKIAACYPRAVKWLFHAGGAPLPQEGVEFLNMRTSSAEEIISLLLGEKTPVRSKREIQLQEKGDWIPWFPVIDYDRCKNCMQCLNFCLFGVYGLDEKGQVQVINPAGCKTNCPACARLCPQTAIIFPKYTDSPINGGEVDNSKTGTQNLDLDITSLSHSDIHELIRQRSRSKKRFSKDKTDRRQVNIASLQKQLDIPSNVLASLSSDELGRLKKNSEKKKHE